MTAAPPVRSRPNPPVRVLHLRDTHDVGGPGKTIIETHRAIDPSRFQLHLAVFTTRFETGETPFVTAARDARLPVSSVRGRNQYDPRMIWKVAALAKGLGVHLLHSHEVKSDVIGYLASRVNRLPILTTLHGWIGNGRRQRAMTALDKCVVRRFDAIIAVSSQIRSEAIAAGAPEQKVHLLHNAIVLARYSRSGREAFLSDLVGRSLERPVLVSIGRLSLEKGHEDLLDALAALQARGSKPSLVLVGDGPERASLADRVRALGLQDQVFMTGYVDHPEAVLEGADLMVLPSHTEGLPNAALEALAMEVPVLATRVGGTPEVITDGSNGRLVPPHSPDALADAIAQFVSDTAGWRQLAQRGRTLVERHFSFEARTRKLETIYEDLAGRMA